MREVPGKWWWAGIGEGNMPGRVGWEDGGWVDEISS